MDQRLLDALNNLSLALEELNESLDKSKSGEAKTDVGTTLQSGDFGNTLKEISVGIKSIKDDTKKILDNQQTLIKMQKEQSSTETKVFEEAGGGKTKQMIKDGVAVIGLIAGAVLAIGLAFKIIGNVDFVSVIALSLSLPLIAKAFAMVSQIENLDIRTIGLVSFALVTMSLGLMLSSHILSAVAPVGIAQLITVIGISAAFGAAALGLGKFINDGFAAIVFAPLIAFGLPIILIALSYAITESSKILQAVQPIGLIQLLTVVLIAAAFGAVSMGLGKLVEGLGKLNPAMAIAASFLMPIVLVALSASIVASSYLLSAVQPIGFAQALTAIFISAMFVVLSYSVKPLLQGVKDVKYEDILKGGLVILALVTAVSISSQIINALFEPVSIGTTFNMVLFSIGVMVSTLTLGLAVKGLTKLGITNPSTLIKGAFAIVILAGVIALSSRILSLGDYSESAYPSIDWAIGTGTAFVLFGLSTFALGLLVSGPQALVMLAGVAALTILAGVIVGVSKILSQGTYSKDLTKEWSEATGEAIWSFSKTILLLGAASVGSGLIGLIPGIDNPFEAGKEALFQIASSIVLTSKILSLGDYSIGPTKEWANGVSIALGAFAPIFKIMSERGIMDSLFGGSFSVEDYSNAIKTISMGIVVAAQFFSDNKVAFKNGVPYEWAKGTGEAISAFAPVFKYLSEGSSWWKDTKETTKEMTNAITAISWAIVKSSWIFQFGLYDKFPTSDFVSGVGKSIKSFSYIFDYLSEESGFWRTGKEVIDNMSNAITSISWAIVKSSWIFSLGLYEKFPTADFASGVSNSLKAFSYIFDYLSEESGFWRTGKEVIDNMSNAITSISWAIVKSSWIFSLGLYEKFPTADFASGVSNSLKAFSYIFDYLSEESGFWRTSEEVIDNMSNAITSISLSISLSSHILALGNYSNFPTEDFSSGVGASLKAFSPVFDYLSNSSWFGSFAVADMVFGITGVSSAIALSSHILSSGDYSNYPNVDWVNGVSGAVKNAEEMFLNSSNTLMGYLRVRNTLYNLSDIVDILSGKSTGFFGKPLFGSEEDSLQKSVSNIMMLSIAFDRLSKSMDNLSSSLESIDLEKLQSVKGFTSNVILLSLMDPDMFEEVMEKLEEKGGVFGDLINNFEEQKKSGGISIGSAVSGGSPKSDPNLTQLQEMNKKLDTMTAVLSNISNVVSGDLRTYLLENQNNSQNIQTTSRSDKRLKNIIRKVGVSELGINIYEFTYKFNNQQIYQGVIAQELIGTEFESSLVSDKNGYYSVDYSKLDVEFKKLNKIK